jgi:hypothetical protein
MKDFQIQTNDRGFWRTTFTDYYKGTVRVNESSLATEPTLWISLIKDEKEDQSSAICLTQENARGLIKLLEEFVKTGRLPK